MSPTAPAVAAQASCVCHTLDADALAAANVNPGTCLATDYLNVFNEALMLLGLAGEMPEVLEDLSAWRPVSYEAHFAASGFAAKDTILAAYACADPGLRGAFEAASDALAAGIAATIATLTETAAAGGELGPVVATALEPLQAKAAALDAMIHGGGAAPQTAIDALFDD